MALRHYAANAATARLRIGVPPAFLPCATEAATAAQRERWMKAHRLGTATEHVALQDQVIDYWFGAGVAAQCRVPSSIDRDDEALLSTVKPNYDLWFGGSKETDDTIRERFGEAVAAARGGAYDAWQEHGPLPALALIILLDQFGLNIYRDAPLSFNTSEQAIPIALKAVARGYDRSYDAAANVLTCLPSPMRLFMYLPLMHSEVLQDQELSVQLNIELATDDARRKGTADFDAMKDDGVGFAVLHRDIVRDHGRFPGRNAVMGRTSGPEELKYLENGGVF